jgi:hypothetical protein
MVPNKLEVATVNDQPAINDMTEDELRDSIADDWLLPDSIEDFRKALATKGFVLQPLPQQSNLPASGRHSRPAASAKAISRAGSVR